MSRSSKGEVDEDDGGNGIWSEAGCTPVEDSSWCSVCAMCSVCDAHS
jgi:hypothetical protein